ncbi:hypothetical protein BURMUCGD2M_6723 [Burkholderia multivorans CGD2M]|uniref:Uncharacterized protein n=1 Tax=Burkholderia multivorans CGD2 TaxID=513052 RepID=B9BPV9_9BURK|nr:hypothetical protein BURMUCGD2_6730 [Burkholderia multivorans CGD2]EEE14001.1 hypothetical protein BURMUCGD2M_6723 [Burkholderia multivorans CGD2M]
MRRSGPVWQRTRPAAACAYDDGFGARAVDAAARASIRREVS